MSGSALWCLDLQQTDSHFAPSRVACPQRPPPQHHPLPTRKSNRQSKATIGSGKMMRTHPKTWKSSPNMERKGDRVPRYKRLPFSARKSPPPGQLSSVECCYINFCCKTNRKHVRNLTMMKRSLIILMQALLLVLTCPW